MKPKTPDARGEVSIQIGYGLEGAIPEAYCKRIIENDVIPHFLENDYYGGVAQAVDVLMALASGEITYVKGTEGEDEDSGYGALLIMAVIFLFIWLWARSNMKKGRNNSNNHRGGGFGGGYYHSSGSRSSSRSSSSGSSFDFGGGSFGGGGASGSW